MTEDYFYGFTLTSENKSEVWGAENKEDYTRTHKLIIKQILLGVEAKEDEFNVIEAETMSSGKKIKIPIAILKTGETRHARMDLDFSDSPVTFTLTMGSGPVHIHGQYLSGPADDFELGMEEEMEDMMDEEEGEEDDEEEHPKKKRKISNSGKGKSPSGGAKNNKKK